MRAGLAQAYHGGYAGTMAVQRKHNLSAAWPVVLVGIPAGCWDTGLYATEGGKQPGAFRQARGCYIDADYVKAWTKLEDKVYNFQQNSIV